ncbi:MAG: hypothetical protein HKL80_10495 [Acidimicrobiales bacterium]|nr:hypothetical protein [Acidimicrobiales bacterium]
MIFKKVTKIGLLTLGAGVVFAACSANSGNSSGNQGTSAPPVKPVSSYAGPTGILGAGAPQSNNMMWLLANSTGNKTIVQINLNNGNLGSPQPESANASAIAENVKGIIAVGTSAGSGGAVELRNGTNGALIATTPVSAPVVDIAPSADGSSFYVLTKLGSVSAVQVVSSGGRGVVGNSIPVAGDTISMVPSADGNFLFYLEPNGEVTEISTAGGGSQAHFQVGANAKALALSSDSQTLFVLKCPLGSCNVSVVDVVGQQVEKVIPAPIDTVQIQVSPDGSKIWDAVGNPAYGNVQAFSLTG